MERDFPSAVQFKWAAAILLAYFGLRLLFLATSISPFIPPDETTHFGICSIFSGYPFLPENSASTYQYGLVTNIPWLYYWIMGKLLALNCFGVSDLIFLRLCNIPLAFALVYYLWRTLCLLSQDRLTQILLLVAATNTMMLTFLSAFVSYDNLANLLAAMSIYYLVAFFRRRTPALLCASLLCQQAGCLAKVTLLPLVLALGVVLVLHEWKNLRALPGFLLSCIRNPRAGGVALALALLAGLALNLQLYGGNYLHYRSLNPEMTDVLPLEAAMQYRLIARNHVFELYQTGKASKQQALEMTSQIGHPGDRADAVFMINNFERFKSGELPKLSLPQYAWLWTQRMAAGVFGVFGHLALPANWPQIAPIALLAALTLVALLVRWRPRDDGWIPTQLMAISASYALYFMYQINYRGYLDSGAAFVALQGRYIFPVIGPIYLLSSIYLMRLFQGKAARLGVWMLAVGIFLVCDFPVFLARITPDWTSWPPN